MPGPTRGVRENLSPGKHQERTSDLGVLKEPVQLRKTLDLVSQLDHRGSYLSLGKATSSPTRLAPHEISTAHQQQYAAEFIPFLQTMCILYARVQTNKTGTDCH